jgi:nucleoside-diphosphate-sugar epimerase
LKGVDAVFYLAALSNDPSGELDPSKTLDINYLGRYRVARLSKEYGVKKYVLASSCSIYGFRDDVILDEVSPPNPLTTYAKANFMAEKDTLSLSDDAFTVTALRQATVYGLSPRMRFDVAVNAMALGLFKNNRIPVMRNGDQWRPFVHVRDTSKAFILVLESESVDVNGQVFNVGSNKQNYQIAPLARTLGDALTSGFDLEWYGSPDNRSYRVNFDKIEEKLGYSAAFSPAEGALEIFDSLKEGKVIDSIKTRTVEWYKHLLSSQALLEDIMIRNTIL